MPASQRLLPRFVAAEDGGDRRDDPTAFVDIMFDLYLMELLGHLICFICGSQPRRAASESGGGLHCFRTGKCIQRVTDRCCHTLLSGLIIFPHPILFPRG
jgi:hypothetical protein